MESVIINTNSWHYKLVKFFFPATPWTCYDLCSYRQRLVVASVMASVMASIIATFSLLALLGAATLPYFVYQKYANGMDLSGLSEYIQFLIVAGMIIWLLAIAISLSIAIHIIVRVVYRHWTQTETKKEKSAISEMYTSWKQKICRPIKFD